MFESIKHVSSINNRKTGPQAVHSCTMVTLTVLHQSALRCLILMTVSTEMLFSLHGDVVHRQEREKSLPDEYISTTSVVLL